MEETDRADTDRAPSMLATVVFVAVLVTAAALILWQQDVIARVHGTAAILLYLISALLPAILLFGLFRTIARVTGKFYGLLIEIGGPGALFFIVLLLLIKVAPATWDEPPSNTKSTLADQSTVAEASHFSQQGPKLVGSGAIGHALQGASIALSADGNTAIVGGWHDDNGVGAAWAWIRNNGVWIQQGQKLVGSGALGFAAQGTSVALSADGNTAIVGGARDGGGIGAAWIWRRNGGVWTQQGPKLVGSGSHGMSNQGQAVALSADGSTAMAGGWLDDNQVGAVWVWRFKNGAWSLEQRAGTQEQKLIGSGAFGPADQGNSVAIAADGSTAIIGGLCDDYTVGAAWIWTRADGVWGEQGPKLIGSGAAGKAFQGVSVSISGDGNTALVGGRKDNNFVGAAWVWTRSEVGTWSPDGPKLVGSGWIGNSEQGYSVSLSVDGMNAIVGAPSDDSNAGASWVWKKVGGVWSQQGPKLFGSRSVGNANQGNSVALSADGSTVLVGGYADDNGTGAVWVFVAPAVMSPSGHL